MSSRTKQPKCMDINNYFKLRKLTNNFVNNSYNEYRIIINGYDEGDGYTLEEVNKYLNKIKNDNILQLENIEVRKETIISWENLLKNNNSKYFYYRPREEYSNDIINYIKLFLFKKIKVMSIVNLIMNGNYFISDYFYKNLIDLFKLISDNDNYYFGDDDDDINYFEIYYRNFDDYKCIDGMCNNFKKLQFLE